MNTQKPTIAVTGGTGFIGRSVLRQLVERGHKVSALARRPQEQPGIDYTLGDLNSPDALEDISRTADTFIHIAGLTKARNLKTLLGVNAQGAANAAIAARKAGVRRFILVSSIAAREPHLSDYAQSKRAGEDAVCREVGDMELLIIRPPAILGPGDEATAPMLDILRRGFLPAPAGARRKSSLMSFVYMDDIARFLIEAIERPITQTVLAPHGASPHSTWQDLADTAALVLSKPVRVLPIPPLILTLSAYVLQIIAALFSQSGFFNAGKVRELLHTDWTGNIEIANARTLEEALRLAFGMDIDV